MKKIKITLLMIGMSILLFSSCAKHIYVSYPSNEQKTGKVVLKPNTQTVGTFVTVNDVLLVDKKNVKSVTIVNLPIGENTINFSSDSRSYKEPLNEKIKVEIIEDKEITKIVQVPPMSNGYLIYLSVIGGISLLSLLII